MLSLPSRECGLKYYSPSGWSTPDGSLPSRECGLKFCHLVSELAVRSVTPLAGVWIEITVLQGVYGFEKESLPSRECGLKWEPLTGVEMELMSLPSRECGLKSSLSVHCCVAPSHSPRGSVD